MINANGYIYWVIIIAKRKSQRVNNLWLLKEIGLSVLAIASIVTLGYEFIASPTAEVVRIIARFEMVVALIFLADFVWQLVNAKDRAKFFRQNWYLLLASIPLVDSWTEALRVLRILPLVRLLRTGEHVRYVSESIGGKLR